MAEMDKKEVAEEEQSLMEKVTILDFDMLCATVAMQSQKGKWDKLNSDEYDEEEGLIYANANGVVFRMWEGELINDCFDDRRLALQSACCPCYRFGKNMKRAGFGSSFLQGSVYVSLCLLALVNILAFLVTRRRCFLYLGAGFIISVGLYLGMFRTQIRKKFNISESDSAFDDCVYHLACPCCSLSQESRTLEMNNVQDGIWHGRGDTVCIGSQSEGAKAYIERNPPPVMLIHSTEPQISSKSKQETTHSGAPTIEPTAPLA